EPASSCITHLRQKPLQPCNGGNIGVIGRRRADDDPSRRSKTGDIVDMAVGLHVRVLARKPKNRFRTRVLTQHSRNLFASDSRISIWIEQALFRCDERAFSVNMNGTALAHNGRTKRFAMFLKQYSAGKR